MSKKEIKRMRLGKLSYLVPKDKLAGQVDGCHVRPVHRTDPFGKVITFLKITPLVDGPEQDVFKVHWGGGRVYGGGTSKKSKNNARKKSRK